MFLLRGLGRGWGWRRGGLVCELEWCGYGDWRGIGVFFSFVPWGLGGIGGGMGWDGMERHTEWIDEWVLACLVFFWGGWVRERWVLGADGCV